MSLLSDVKRARSCSVPIIRITTPDPINLMLTLANDGDPTQQHTEAPKVGWDCIRGHFHLNKAGESWINSKLSIPDPKDANKFNKTNIVTAPEAVGVLLSLPENSIAVMLNAHRYLTNDANGARFIQVLMNIRDRFKNNGRTLFLLTTDCPLPIELQHDVVSLSEDYPDDKALKEIIEPIFNDAKLSPTNDMVERIVDGIRGLPAFPAEQVTAMATTIGKGVDVDLLWRLKEQQIKNIKGLRFDTSRETFDDLGGLLAWKTFTHRLLSGRQRFKLVVRLEEIEKAMAGVGGDGKHGDTSGVSAGILGYLLEVFEDYGWTGALLFGVPGSGKSASSKALGNTFGIKTMVMDIAGAKESYVGASEQNVREQVKAIKAIGGNDILFLASCNGLDALPPALKRRFKLGVWFFNTPTKEERESIWTINVKKFSLNESQELPDQDGLTGADIRNICEIAYQLSSPTEECSLAEAAQYIVPVCKSDPTSITQMQTLADGRFLSASLPGIYRMNPEEEIAIPESKQSRRFAHESDPGFTF